MIGKIQRVPLREVWKHESYDFTKWLQENLDVLNEVLDFTLSSAEREKSTGNFNVDLIAEDDDGNSVIIENQLEKSNHDHLGKLITYLAALEAKKAIWIVADPRPEHVGAITWLNDSSSAEFFLLKAEAIRIGESPPAPLLTLIVGPSEGRQEIRETKEDLAETKSLRRKFWTMLLAKAKERTNLHATVSPGPGHWLGTGAGISGLAFNYLIRKDSACVELYISRGKEKTEENKKIFDALANEREKIEKNFGGPLEWQRLEGKSACRIKKEIETGGLTDQDKWPAIQDEMIDVMICFEKALKPYLSKISL